MKEIHKIFDEIISSKNQFEKTKNRAKFLRGFYTKRNPCFYDFDFTFICDASKNGVHLASVFETFKRFREQQENSYYRGKYDFTSIASTGDFGGMIVYALGLMAIPDDVEPNLDEIRKWFSRANLIQYRMPTSMKVYYIVFENALNGVKYSGNNSFNFSNSMLESAAIEKHPTTSGVAYGNNYTIWENNKDKRVTLPICNLLEPGYSWRSYFL